MKKIIPLVYILFLFIFIFSHLFLSYEIPHEINVYKGKVSFDGSKAYQYAYNFSKNFPKRHVGSEGNYKAFLWLKLVLESFGYKVKTQDFKVYIEKPLIGRNLYAILDGKINETIGILANYDMVPMSLEAASDTSGSVGILLEIAYSMRFINVSRNIAFIFVDSEEWGMQGARYFIEKYEGPALKTVIVIEDLTVGKLKSIYLESMGQFKGYSPLWLRTLAKDVAKFSNISIIDPVGLEEYIYRAINISFTDQGPIIAKGIPSIEISTRGDKPELSKEVYHTEKDVMENMEIETFQKYGEYIMRLILSLDKAKKIPSYDDNYLLVSNKKYLPGILTFILPSLFIIPLVIHIIYEKENIKKIIQAIKEIFYYFLLLIPSILIVYLSVNFEFIPKYDTYPPPPRHPFLYSPNYFLIFLFFFIPFILIFILSRKINHEKSKCAILITLLITLIFSLIYNRFGTVVFLSQAIFLWPFVKNKRKIFNFFFIFLSLTMFLFLLINFGQLLYLDSLIVWYLILGIAYGQFKLIGNLISLFFFSIFVYLIINYLILNYFNK